MISVLRWLGQNITSLLLALSLALMVWFTAVLNADPNQECTDLTTTTLEIIGQEPILRRSGDIPAEISVSLLAPSSICAQMTSDPAAVRAILDLSGLGDGEHTVDVQVLPLTYQPVRLLDYSPKSVIVRLDTLAARSFTIRPVINGEPAPGYTALPPVLDASQVQVTGLKSRLDQVVEAVVNLDLTDVTQDFTYSAAIQLLDVDGTQVSGLTLVPERVTIRQALQRPGNVRDVTVRPITTGQQEEGYQLTYISVSPQVVTLFSTNLQVLRDLPGFVETMPLDLTGATDDVERRLTLNLPEGVSVFGKEQTVLVQVGIAAIERSKPLFALPIEVIGVTEGLEARLSTATVDVIFSGPGPLLDLLTLQDVRVFLDASNLAAGLYSLEPNVEILPSGIRIVSVLPGTIEVTIAPPPTPTPTPTLEGTPGPSPTGAPAGTPQPTPKP